MPGTATGASIGPTTACSGGRGSECYDQTPRLLEAHLAAGLTQHALADTTQFLALVHAGGPIERRGTMPLRLLRVLIRSYRRAVPPPLLPLYGTALPVVA
jgi:hypothetical protein